MDRALNDIYLAEELVQMSRQANHRHSWVKTMMMMWSMMRMAT
jgi:hypothetical protein